MVRGAETPSVIGDDEIVDLVERLGFEGGVDSGDIATVRSWLAEHGAEPSDPWDWQQKLAEVLREHITQVDDKRREILCACGLKFGFVDAKKWERHAAAMVINAIVAFGARGVQGAGSLPDQEAPSEALTRSRIDHWLRNRGLRFEAYGPSATVDGIMDLLETLGEYAHRGSGGAEGAAPQ